MARLKGDQEWRLQQLQHLQGGLMVHRFVASVLGVLLGLAATAEATLVTFSNKAAFLTATGATSATGALPDAGAVAPGFGVGSVTFTTLSGQFFIGTGGLFPTQVTDWSATIPGNDIAISGPESFRVDLAAPVYSLGFDFFEPVVNNPSPPVVTDDCFAPCFDSTFTVTLFSGATALGSFIYNAPDATLAFEGVWTDFAFDRVEIVDTTGTADDEYWGQFYTGTTPVVPEPGSVALLGSGLLVLYLRRRRG
jgi:hypothetical protein